MFQVESLKEQIWEIDTSNRNNLVFYGVKDEVGPPEIAIRDVLRRSDQKIYLIDSLNINSYWKIIYNAKYLDLR